VGERGGNHCHYVIATAKRFCFRTGWESNPARTTNSHKEPYSATSPTNLLQVSLAGHKMYIEVMDNRIGH